MSGKISIVVVSGVRERLHMASMIAAVGAVSGDAVTVFLSMNALCHFRRGAADAAPTEGEFGPLLAAKGAPGFKQLFQQAVELGEAKVHPCSMALDVLALGPNDLEPWLAPPLGLTKFLADAHGGQVWSF